MDVLSIKENYRDNEIVDVEVVLNLTEEENELLIEKAVNVILEEYIEREKEKKSKWEFTP